MSSRTKYLDWEKALRNEEIRLLCCSNVIFEWEENEESRKRVRSHTTRPIGVKCLQPCGLRLQSLKRGCNRRKFK